MKVIKRLFLVILTIININVVVTLIICFNFQKVLIDGVLKETIKTQITSSEYEEPNITINENATSSEDLIITDDETINKILESDEIQDLLEDYMNKTLSSLEDPNNLEDIDFEEDIINYLKENKEKIEEVTGVEITDEMIDNTKDSLEEKDINNYIKQKIRNTSNNMTTTEKILIKGYSFFISIKFKVILGIIYTVNLFLIALIKKSFYKWISNLSLSFLIGGVETIVISLIINMVVINNTIFSNFNTNPLIKWGIIITIIGIFIMIVYNVIIKLFKREKKYE